MMQVAHTYLRIEFHRYASATLVQKILKHTKMNRKNIGRRRPNRRMRSKNKRKKDQRRKTRRKTKSW